MRRSIAILGTLAMRPDIRAAVAVASVIASGAATYWWCVRNRRRMGLARLLAGLEMQSGREKALAALRIVLAGMHKTMLRGSLGPPTAAARTGVIVTAPGVQAGRRAHEWYYRLAGGAAAGAFGALLISFDREGRVYSVRLIDRPLN